MSSIKAFESLTGYLSETSSLSGDLSCNGNLSGEVSANLSFKTYDGEYEIVPDAFSAQTLPTANKLLKEDLVVQKVPYYETSNIQNGVTVYIAEEVK